jgi:hypothetical protein
MVVRTLAFVIVRRVLGLVGLGSAPDAKDIEIAVPRHPLMVLRRQVARPRYTPQDRLVLAMLARLLCCLVTDRPLPSHAGDVGALASGIGARRWTYPAAGLGSRGIGSEPFELVLRMARENPRWGYIRIVGECRKLAQCSRTMKILADGQLSPGWRSQKSCARLARI